MGLVPKRLQCVHMFRDALLPAFLLDLAVSIVQQLADSCSIDLTKYKSNRIGNNERERDRGWGG